MNVNINGNADDQDDGESDNCTLYIRIEMNDSAYIHKEMHVQVQQVTQCALPLQLIVDLISWSWIFYNGQ